MVCYCLATIPPFDPDGKLPPGIHTCTWREFVDRFGTTQHRLRLISGLKVGIAHLQEVNCQTIYIDGSFVTHKLMPGDFDACWDTNGVNMDQLNIIAPALLNFTDKRLAQKELYGGEFFPAGWPANSTGRIFLDFFQQDRDGYSKGIISIDLIRWQP